jgi:hypothetical protein
MSTVKKTEDLIYFSWLLRNGNFVRMSVKLSTVSMLSLCAIGLKIFCCLVVAIMLQYISSMNKLLSLKLYRQKLTSVSNSQKLKCNGALLEDFH